MTVMPDLSPSWRASAWVQFLGIWQRRTSGPARIRLVSDALTAVLAASDAGTLTVSE